MQQQFLINKNVLFTDDHVVNFRDPVEALTFVPILLRGFRMDEAERGQHVTPVSDTKVMFFKKPIHFKSHEDAEAAMDLFTGRVSKNAVDDVNEADDELQSFLDAMLKDLPGFHPGGPKAKFPEWQLTTNGHIFHSPSGQLFDFGDDVSNEILKDGLLVGQWPEVFEQKNGGLRFGFPNNPSATIQLHPNNVHSVLRFVEQFKLNQPFSFELSKRVTVQAKSKEEAFAKVRAENPGFDVER